MTKRTPLYEVEEALGARFESQRVPGPDDPEVVWSVASAYSSLDDECRAIRERAGLVDLSHRGKIDIRGPDRVRYLNGQVTNDVKKLAAGQGCYACALNYKGALVADLNIYAEPDCFLIDTSENASRKLLDHLWRFAISDEVEILDKGGDIAHLGIHGPQSIALMNQLTQADVGALDVYGHRPFQIGEFPVEVIRQEYTGEWGFDIFVETKNAAGLWKLLLSHGKNFDVKPVGSNALDVLRLEAGVPMFGVDMTEEHLALEANLLSAISTDKGCYTGQEVVARIMNRGHVNRILSGLSLEGLRIPGRAEKVFKDDTVVGEITRAAFSPTLNRVIAFAYLPTLRAQPGALFTVGEASVAQRAEVAALPFYKRMRSD